MSADLPMGDRTISHLISSPNSETGQALRQSFPIMVLAPTGQEPRPSAQIAIWLGPSRPVNMASNDLWFNPSTVDTQAPTVPNGLQASNTTTTSLTLSWNPSTDNIAATLYEVYQDGILVSSTATTSKDITDLAPNTQYSFTVRAKDEAENWSALSQPLLHSTLSSVIEHSVYQSTYPITLTKSNDGGTITLATAFYTYGAGSAYTATGARLYVPEGITVPSTATMYLWQGNDTLITATPLRTKALSNISTGWNSLHWDSEVALTPSEYVWIGYKFDNGDYLAGTDPTDHFSSPAGVAEGSAVGGGAYPVRSQYAITSGSTGRTQSLYGIDIITAE